MFGYVKPFQPELRVKELEAYKAVYCGLCGQLGRSFGPLARLTLSYDFAFYSMLWWAVHEEQPSICRHRCFVNPLKKQTICIHGEALEMGADAAILLLYYKLLDNIRDGSLLKKAGYIQLRPWVSAAKRKAAARRPEHAAIIAREMERQEAMERQAPSGVDAACEPTAAMLGGLFRLLSEDAVTCRVLERMGYFLGRYIYLCDALDDWEADRKTGNYNPLVLRCTEAAQAAELAQMSLNLTISEVEKAMRLLPMGSFAPIIENIVTMGLQKNVQDILTRKKEKAANGSL